MAKSAKTAAKAEEKPVETAQPATSTATVDMSHLMEGAEEPVTEATGEVNTETAADVEGPQTEEPVAEETEEPEGIVEEPEGAEVEWNPAFLSLLHKNFNIPPDVAMSFGSPEAVLRHVELMLESQKPKTAAPKDDLPEIAELEGDDFAPEIKGFSKAAKQRITALEKKIERMEAAMGNISAAEQKREQETTLRWFDDKLNAELSDDQKAVFGGKKVKELRPGTKGFNTADRMWREIMLAEQVYGPKLTMDEKFDRARRIVFGDSVRAQARKELSTATQKRAKIAVLKPAATNGAAKKPMSALEEAKAEARAFWEQNALPE